MDGRSLVGDFCDENHSCSGATAEVWESPGDLGELSDLAPGPGNARGFGCYDNREPGLWGMGCAGYDH